MIYLHEDPSGRQWFVRIELILDTWLFCEKCKLRHVVVDLTKRP